MTESQAQLLRDVLTELRFLRADIPLLRNELQRVASEHEGLRLRVEALEDAPRQRWTEGGHQ